MARGYMGRLLTIDLTVGRFKTENVAEDTCRAYVGGYGLAARLLYDRIPAGSDPLGPENTLCFMTGPLTGTPAVIGSRFVVAAKSPKTAGGWGDANCGGFFGPHLKFAGYDGLVFSGVSNRPVYLMIDEGKAELLDANELWGMGVTQLEDTLKERHGKDIEICSIGTAGEQLSLISCIMNDKERSAARSGLGAVMGSKKLKAIAVKGRLKVPIHDEESIRSLRRKILGESGGFYDTLRDYGTAGITHDSALSGDSPVKNWGGAGTVDFPSDRAKKIDGSIIVELEGCKRYACWGCPIACGGKIVQRKGKYALELNDGVGHKPEYETLAMLGTNLLNDNLESINKVNEICNNLGLDTIAVGAVLGYVIELSEIGLLSKNDVDGLELSWGNDEAIVTLTEKIGMRDGFGDLLADGVKVAWERLGQIGTEYAIHIQGEELPAHDPKFTPGLATTYLLAPTPARHTQGGELLPPVGMKIPSMAKYEASGRSQIHWKLATSLEVCNAAGLCMFGYLSYPIEAIADQLTAVTGWEYGGDEMFKTGMRIFTMRHAFNLREGINPLQRSIPGRVIGKPLLKKGNVRDVSVDYETQINEFLEFVDWDSETTVPSKKSLRDLEMEFLINDLHPNT